MNIPELLSPAGSPACALAAFDAGADAVYAGLSKFNARERGENFTADSLGRIVDYAHSLNRKVYLTLNTLIKESEISEVVETLGVINDIAPDGVLIQDLGILRIAREYFPALELHGSTQMGFHNSVGLQMAEQLGLTRVVLERQVTMEELAAIRKRTKLELEVFIHGALCCSLSGACLFSSYLGGWSGNRGKCKQPCRRRYYSKNGNGFFFSPQDLCAIELLPQLCKIGVNSLKIEGRLRQPDYVENTVKAYRMLLDAPESEFAKLLPEARNILSRTCTRKWSHGFYTSASARELVKSDALGAAGIRVGNVEAIRDNGFGFTSSKRLFIGDRLRIQPFSGDDGAALTITKMFVDNRPAKRVMPKDRVFVCCDKEVPENGIVFKIGESFSDYTKRISALPQRKTRLDISVALTAKKLTVKVLNAVMPDMITPLDLQSAQNHPATPEQLLKTFAEADSKLFALGSGSRAEVDGDYFLPAGVLKQIRRDFWKLIHDNLMPQLVTDANDPATALDRFRKDYLSTPHFTVPADAHLVETVAMKPDGAQPADRRAIRADNLFDINKLSQEAIFPEFCPEHRLASVAKAVANAYAQGIRRFRVTSLYALAMLQEYEDITIIASAPLPVCNSVCANELKRFNVSRVCAHLEMTRDDMLALRDHSPVEVECFRLGRPALLVTRAAIPFDGTFNDARGNKFELRFEKISGLSRIFPVKAVSIPRIPGVYDFYDLRNAHWKNSECDTFNFDKEWN